MKDHVEIDHLTKYDDYRVNRDQVVDFEIKLKSIQTLVSSAAVFWDVTQCSPQRNGC